MPVFIYAEGGTGNIYSRKNAQEKTGNYSFHKKRFSNIIITCCAIDFIHGALSNYFEPCVQRGTKNTRYAQSTQCGILVTLFNSRQQKHH